MDIVLPKAGRYVLAVSGGVDSVVLLDILSRQGGLELVVAHFDHGIRADSADDRRFVEKLASTYDLPYEYTEGRLGPKASEAAARKARYDFLGRLQKEQKALAIITAHHQDDVLETAIINILRGTGRKGLTALRSREDVIRPLLKVPKSELITYAKDRDLRWHEDPTNADLSYLRNYVRHKLLTRFSSADRQQLVDILTKLTITNKELDSAIQDLLVRQPAGQLDRQWFNQLPHAAAREVMAGWLRAGGAPGFDRKTLERLVVSAKAAPAGQTFPVQAGFYMCATVNHLALVYN